MNPFSANKSNVYEAVNLWTDNNHNGHAGVSNDQARTYSTAPWQAQVLRRLPWDAFLSLFIAIGCVLFTIFIIVMANGDSIDNWKVTPGVYLAISSAIAGIVLRYAFKKGVEISWWVAALGRGGTTTMADLHQIWLFSTSLRSALLAGHNFNLVALASILLAFVPANAPLAQRALRTINRPATFNMEVPIVAASFLNETSGATSLITGRTGQINFITPEFAPILQDYLLSTPITLASLPCRNTGTCRGILRAAGYKMACVEGTDFFDKTPGLLHDINEDGTSPFNDSVVFSTDFEYMRNTGALVSPGESVINVTAKFKEHGKCKGDLAVRNCTIAPATVGYHIVIVNSTIALDSSYTYKDDELITYTNTSDRRVHGGIFLALRDQFSASVALRFTGAAGYDMTTEGVAALRYSRRAKGNGEYLCKHRWLDPTQDILMSARELIFRLALQGNNTAVVSQLVYLTQEDTEVVYTSEPLFVGLALMLIGLTVFAVVPLFWHWWCLGRDVSLSPIEIARAFGAPELAGSGSNLDAERLIKDIGAKDVRYGVVTTQQSMDYPGRVQLELKFSHPSLVQAPEKGKQY